jgi:four helix bundle protein
LKNFKTLDAAIEFYELIEKLKMQGHLREQILRSASSISLNLAEGNAKYSKLDKMRIYQIAMGSLRESQVILKLAKIDDTIILAHADKLAASLYKLIESHKIETE